MYLAENASYTSFHLARHVTLPTCLACRLNHPQVYPHPQHPKAITETSKFGLAPTCNGHYQSYCVGCLSIGELHGALEPGVPRRGLIRSALRDLDEHGVERPWINAVVCRRCRTAAIEWQLRLILTDCAYNGPVRGINSAWRDYGNEAYDTYVDESYRTAVGMAHLAVEEQWLKEQTQWNELLPFAHHLQRNEGRIKRRYKRCREEETAEERNERLQLLCKLGLGDNQSIINDDTELRCLYNQWDVEAELMKCLEEDDSDNDDDEDDDALQPKVST